MNAVDLEIEGFVSSIIEVGDVDVRGDTVTFVEECIMNVGRDFAIEHGAMFNNTGRKCSTTHVTKGPFKSIVMSLAPVITSTGSSSD